MAKQMKTYTIELTEALMCYVYGVFSLNLKH